MRFCSVGLAALHASSRITNAKAGHVLHAFIPKLLIASAYERSQ
jgi:hypothetical protein